MLKSMTAFGRATVAFAEREITVEMRSVNNRFFDCSVRMPRSLGFTDDRIKPFLTTKGISRGKVDVSISVENQAEAVVGLELDEAYATAYISALRDLRDRFGLVDDISVMTVASDKNVFTVKKPEADEEKDWKEVSSVLSAATDAFIAARAAEGQRIELDIRGKLAAIEEYVNKIEQISEKDISGSRQKIEEKLRHMLSDLKITADENRILTECAIYADRIAIDEELVRLRSHFKAFTDILEADEPAGRKLDFLMQEMNREINTIGSKCQNADAAQLVVAVKCELEKIREQIQNIE